MLANKLILCVSNISLTAGIWHGNKLQTYTVFDNDETGLNAFNDYLKNHIQTAVYLIADAVEEDYRLETLPHTAGKTRKEMIERKLNQFNRNNLYRTAHYIGRDKDKRRDDHFLFVSLNNADFLQNWMQIIQLNQVPLVGLYLLPMISQVYVQQMKLAAPNILLCERLSSGLRQTYLYNGRLRMSRLVPMSEVKSNQVAYFYLVEIEKTRLYLISQRFISGDAVLHLVIPSLDSNSEVIGKSISQEQGLECKVVDLLAFAKNSNISPDLVKQQPELLHMQLLANGHVPDSLAPAQYTKAHQFNQIRRNVHIATAIASLIGITLAGYYYWQGLQQKNTFEEYQRQTVQQQSLYENVARNFPATPIPSQDLKIAAELSQTIKSLDKTPQQLMQILSAALEKTPEIALSRIRWVQTDNPNMLDDENNAPQQSQSNQTQIIEIGFINAEITRFDGDYRAALNSVNQFVALIKANPAVETVDILQEPVNVSSLARLEGSTQDESTTERLPAVFKLKIILKSVSPVVNIGNLL